MKEKLPWISIFTLGASLIIMLIMGLAGFDLIGLAFIALLPMGAILVAEIVGIVLRFWKKLKYADCIAVLAVSVISLAATIIYAINDMNSSGWFAGLAGMLALIFFVPVIVLALISDGVIFFKRRKKLKQQNNEEMH